MNPSVAQRSLTTFVPPDSPSSATTLAAFFRREGYALVENVLTPDQTLHWIACTEKARTENSSSSAVSNSSGVYALRNLVDIVPETTELLKHPALTSIVTAILGQNAFLVRSTLFDKTDGANWGVFWHQDLAIAVKERHELPGFHAWTKKAGVVCVQPPTEILSQILTVRLSLDACHADNGALKVLPGSHSAKWNSGDIDQMTREHSEVLCETRTGGAVLMSPLTLHASSPMNVPGHRRVIHFEFAAMELPEPLEWNYRLPICPNDTTSV